MRLIDADELKEFIERLDESFFFYSEIVSIIDNAPTVNIIIPRDQSDYLGGKNYESNV